MSWSDERIQELTRLWQAGHSASEIGKLLDVSKNAVVGKAHRLKLPSRPSPIKQQAPGAGVAAQAKTAPTMTRQAGAAPAKPAPSRKPAAAEAAGARAASAGPAGQPESAPSAQPGTTGGTAATSTGNTGNTASTAGTGGGASAAAGQARRPRPEAASGKRSGEQRARTATQRQKVEARSNASGCLWPIGDPGDADFHFCGAQPVPGKPYCAEHAARAYITRSRPERGEEAA